MSYSNSKIYPMVKFGSDPEFFLRDPDGRIVSSDVVFGWPEEKKDTFLMGSIHADGVQAEINHKPSYCRGYISDAIHSVMSFAKGKLKKDYTIDFSPALELTEEEFDSLSARAKAFGCDPEFDAWSDGDVVPKPSRELLDSRWRYAGGHIHISLAGAEERRYVNSSTKKAQIAFLDEVINTPKQQELIRLLDVLVGNSMVLLDQLPGSTERRIAYGRAGSYRPQPHGVEYRVLSNFWMRHPALMYYVMAFVRTAIQVYVDGKYDEVMSVVDKEDVFSAIDNNNPEIARITFEKVLPFMVDSFDTEFDHEFTKRGIAYFNYLAETGITNVFHDDFYDNWGVGRDVYHGDGIEIPRRLMARI